MFIGAIIVVAGTNDSKHTDRSRGSDRKDDKSHDPRGGRSDGTAARPVDYHKREEKAGEK